MKTICSDLKAEYEALDGIVSNLQNKEWETMTPFCDWTIRDEISHIAWADGISLLAATNEVKFKEHVSVAMKDPDALFEEAKKIGRSKTPAQILKWWRQERNCLITELQNFEPKHKLPWYGPPMNARSFATARIMETWAHGQDIVDALGAERQSTERLYHIAHLGVRTMGFAYQIRQKKIPKAPIRIELKSPSNELWDWGPQEAENTIRGTAKDFCLAVTRRRHIKDTALEIKGETAGEWMTICQVFAGAPEKGAEAGRFPKKE